MGLHLHITATIEKHQPVLLFAPGATFPVILPAHPLLTGWFVAWQHQLIEQTVVKH